MLKNRTAIGILCILLAITLTFFVAPAINRQMAEKQTIIRVKSNILQGQQIKESMIEVVEVGGYNLPADVIKDKDEVIGKYAVSQIYKDDYFTPDKISLQLENTDYYFRTMSETETACSISINSLASGLSSRLRVGDIVQVIVTYGKAGEDEEELGVVYDELQYMRVIGVHTETGIDAKAADNGTETDKHSTITLIATSTVQTQRLSYCENNGKIHLALVFRGEKSKADKYIEMQEKIIADLEKEKEAEEQEAEEQATENKPSEPIQNNNQQQNNMQNENGGIINE